jgi:predicted MFS family arabinose efflux permease
MKHLGKFIKTPELRMLLLEFFIFTLIFYAFTASLTLYLERVVHADAKQLGLLYGYVGLLILSGQGILIRLMFNRFKERQVARFGFLSCFMGFLVLLFLPHHGGWVIVATTLFALGISQLRPTLTSIITQTASRGEQGSTLGVTQSADSLSAILGPAIGGAAITFTPINTFAVLEAAGALLGLLLLGRKSAQALNRTHIA